MTTQREYTDHKRGGRPRQRCSAQQCVCERAVDRALERGNSGENEGFTVRVSGSGEEVSDCNYSAAVPSDRCSTVCFRRYIQYTVFGSGPARIFWKRGWLRSKSHPPLQVCERHVVNRAALQIGRHGEQMFDQRDRLVWFARSARKPIARAADISFFSVVPVGRT